MDEQFILEKLKTFDGEIFDLCYEICEHIYFMPLEEQAFYVKTLCQNYGYISSDKSYEISPKATKEDISILRDNYGKYINETIAATLKKGYYNNWGTDEFYNALWKSMCSNEIITTTIERTFALYYIAIDRRVPYFRLDMGVEMDNETFKQLLKDNDEAIKKIRFIMFSDFNQKTEKASLLIDEILDADAAEDQIIRMVSIIEAFKEEKKHLQKVIRQITTEDD